jgi:AcrR family transcriptional regulator
VQDQPIRERLIAAGVELLEAEGIAAVGLRAITRRAGVSHGAPRRYFPTHALLLAEIAATGIADLNSRIGALLAVPGDRSEVLLTVGVRYVDFAIERPEMFNLMFRHDLLADSGANLRARSLPVFAAFTEFLGGGDAAALAVLAAIHGVAALSANRAIRIFGPDIDPHDLVRHTLAPYLD